MPCRSPWSKSHLHVGNVLFRAGAESLRELLADDRYLGGVPGMLASLHTWDQTLLIHPHVHVMVSAGGLDADGCWRTRRRTPLLNNPVERVHDRVCRDPS